MIPGTDWIRIKLAGKVFTYPVPATLDGGASLTTLNSDQMLTLNLDLTTDDVTFATGEISGWTDGGTIDSGVEIGAGPSAP